MCISYGQHQATVSANSALNDSNSQQVAALPAAVSPAIQCTNEMSEHQHAPLDRAQRVGVQPSAVQRVAFTEAVSPHDWTAPQRLPPIGQSAEAVANPDPVVLPKLTLDQAIRCLLRADPKLHAGYEAVRQANADALTASLLPNPQLFTDGQLLPFNGSFTPKTQGGPTQQDANIVYPVDWFLFGKRAAAMAGAATGVRISEAEFADLVRQRVLETAVAFFDVVEANALLDLARQDVQNLDAVLGKAVQERGHTDLELNRVRLNLLSSRRSQREAESAVVASKARLRSILGQVDANPTFDVAGSLDMTRSVDPFSVDEAFALALQSRSDIAALRSKVDQGARMRNPRTVKPTRLSQRNWAIPTNTSSRSASRMRTRGMRR